VNEGVEMASGMAKRLRDQMGEDFF
jgi:hypothetical protein